MDVKLKLLSVMVLTSCATVPVVSHTEAPPSRADCGASVLVVGAVAAPGHFTVREASTLLQAIDRAGGFLPEAHRDSVVIERCAEGRSEALKITSSRVVPGGEGDLPLLKGDLVRVPTYD